MLNGLLRYDPGNLYSVLEESWKQGEFGWNSSFTLNINTSDISDIIITGLGGSAISGDLIKNFLGHELKKPLSVNRTYTLPEFADEHTLVIASSYSGNTEETISALHAAIAKNCKIIVLTTGGEAGRIAAENGIDTVPLQKGFQPRYALYNSFFTLLRVFQKLNLTAFSDSDANKLISMLKDLGQRWAAESGNAFKTAVELKGFTPVIYSATDFNEAAGRRFKGQLNENSKLHAWAAEYPEMNHNEIVGWETFKIQGVKYKIVNLFDEEMHPRVKKRFEIINNLLNSEKIDIIKLEGTMGSRRERLIEIVYLCDWISYYLALLNEKDPGEIDFIHHLKDKMAEV